MTLDISASAIKGRAVDLVLEKVRGVALIGMVLGAVAVVYVGQKSFGTLKDSFAFEPATATITGVESYCRLGKLNLRGESKGFKFSDDIACADAYALEGTPEYDGYKLFEKVRYSFTYTAEGDALVEATKPSHIIGPDTLVVGDRAEILVDPGNPQSIISANKPVVSSAQAIIGAGGFLVLFLSLFVRRLARARD